MSKIKNFKPDPNSRYKQGYYKPINESKYASRDPRIIYRSGLELKFCTYCDTTDSVIRWASEPIAIPYMNPISNTNRNYYPDYIVEIEAGGEKITYMVEVKSSNMLTLPKKPSKYASRKKKNSWARHAARVLVNMAKYQAAKKFCESRGMVYTFLTEDFFKKKP